jgi:hypothetical protein
VSKPGARPNTSLPTTDSLSSSALPSSCFVTTKQRNLDRRSLRTNSALDKILSNCFRIRSALRAVEGILLGAILACFKCVSCVDNP